MKRNLKLALNILEEIESRDQSYDYENHISEFEFTIDLLVEGGFICKVGSFAQGCTVEQTSGVLMLDLRLTWTGYDLLEKLQNQIKLQGHL